MPVRNTWTADEEEQNPAKALPGSDSPNDPAEAPASPPPITPYTPPAAPPPAAPPAPAPTPTTPPVSAPAPAAPPVAPPPVQTTAPMPAAPAPFVPAMTTAPTAPPQPVVMAPPPPPSALPEGLTAAGPGSVITEYAPNMGSSAPPTAPTAPTRLEPSPVDSILPLLTGGASGANTSPLEDATTQATLDALKNPNPYNAEEVQREFADLGAGIDADFDTRQRNLTNNFAQRGLYGSLGKDFASGRAADTEVGRRTSKTQLANALATAQAQSAAGARRDAIAQGQAGTNAKNGNQLNWLQALMGYGNDAFNHDLQTAQFQEGQNESEQDYLLRLLQAGYGV